MHSVLRRFATPVLRRRFPPRLNPGIPTQDSGWSGGRPTRSPPVPAARARGPPHGYPHQQQSPFPVSQEDLLPSLDAPAVRAWCRLSLQALGRAREEIDAINVYPVADGDTGTNMYLTVESAAQAVEAVFDGHTAAGGPAPTLPESFRAMSHGALIGARGNSGTILAQLLRGMNESLVPPQGADGGP